MQQPGRGGQSYAAQGHDRRDGRQNLSRGGRGQGRGGRHHNARSHTFEGRNVTPSHSQFRAEAQNFVSDSQHMQQLTNQPTQLQPMNQQRQQQQSTQQHSMQQQMMQQPVQQPMQQPMHPMQRAVGGSGNSLDESNMDWGLLSLDDSPMKPPSWGASTPVGVMNAAVQGGGRANAGRGMGRVAQADGGRVQFMQAMQNVQGQQHAMGPGGGAQRQQPLSSGHPGHSFEQSAMLAAGMRDASDGGVHTYQQQQFAAPVEGGSRGPAKGRGREHLIDQSALLAAALRSAATNQGLGAAAPLGGARGIGQGHMHAQPTEPMVAVPLQALSGHMGGMHDASESAGVNQSQGHGQISAANLCAPQRTGTVNIQSSGAAYSYDPSAVHKIQGAKFDESIARERSGGHSGMARSPRGPEPDGVGFGRGGAGGRGTGGREAGHTAGRSAKGALQGNAEMTAPPNPRAEAMLGAFMDMYDALSRLRN